MDTRMKTQDEDTFERLLGVWEVETFTFTDESGTHPWRSDVHGMLLYEPNGRMSLAVNSAVSGDHPYDSIFFYAGTFEVRDREVIHDVKNASNPARIGKRLVRRFELRGDRLTLSGSDGFGSGEISFIRAGKIQKSG